MSDATTPTELRVLLVEDSPRIAERLRELIDSTPGLRVVSTADAQAQALAILAREPVDAMVLDLQLRAGTGFGILESLGTQRPDTIIFTNHAIKQYRDKAQRLGVRHFLNKAVDHDQLVEILVQLRDLKPPPR